MQTRTIARVLFLILVLDVSYGAITYGTPYGCGYPNRTDLSPQPQRQTNPLQPNWQILTTPCFYIYYYGIVGGSATLIFFLPPLKKKENNS